MGWGILASLSAKVITLVRVWQSLFRVYSDSVVKDREVCCKCHHREKSMYLVYLYERILMSPYLRVLLEQKYFIFLFLLAYPSFLIISPFLYVSPSLVQSRLICYLFKILMCFKITLLRIRLFTQCLQIKPDQFRENVMFYFHTEGKIISSFIFVF